MSKLPSFQFYPGDWRKDQNLSRASKAAKGVFMDVMCLAFECEKRGIFKTGKKPWTIEEIAYAVGGDMTENIKCINELLTLNVLKTNRNHTIYQHRMVKDENIRKVRTIAGSKGGNPNLLNQKTKQSTTPSSSSSSSTSVNNTSGEHFDLMIPGEILKGGIVQDMNAEFKKRFPKYPFEKEKDFPALLELAHRIGAGMDIGKTEVVGSKRGEVLKRWGELVDFVRTDRWFSTRSISDLLKEFQRLIQTFETASPVKNLTKTEVDSQIEKRNKQSAKLAEKYGQ